VLSGILIFFIVLSTACAASVLRHSRQSAINRAFLAFAVACVLCLALPIVLFDPFLGAERWPLLLTLYGACYLFAPAAFIPLPLTIYWSGWRRERRTLYQLLFLAPIGLAVALFLLLAISASREGALGELGGLPPDEAFRTLIARPLDQIIRRGFSSVMELTFVALLLPRALRGRTRIERHTAITLLAVSVLSSAFARVPWFTYFGDFTIAGAIISLTLSIRLLVCYRLLVRYRLFSRAGVGVDLAIQRIADGFILVDEHLKVQIFNPAAAQLLPALARGAALPDLPTVVESGVPTYKYESWFGLMARSGTPKDIIAKISKDVGDALKTPDVAAKLTQYGAIPAPTTPEKFDEIIKSDTARYTDVLHAAGVGAK